MAETQKATIGYNGSFALHNGTVLYELVQVKEFDVPAPGAREQVESTHLKSAGYRREYLSGLYEDSSFDVVVNCRPLSSTDELLADAHGDGDVRAFKVVLAEGGTATSQITGTCRCTSYSRGRVAVDGVLEGTATFQVVTIDAIASYAA